MDLSGLIPATFILGVLLVFVIDVLIRPGYNDVKVRRLIKGNVTSLGSLSEGTAKIFGKAMPMENLVKAPFSKKDCIFYYYEIREYRAPDIAVSGGGGTGGYGIIEKGENGGKFHLEDDTGTITVDPHGAQMEVVPEYVDISLNDPRQLKSIAGKSARQFIEYRIDSNDKLFIIGQVDKQQSVINSHSKPFYISNKKEEDILHSLSGTGTFVFYAGIICLLILLGFVGAIVFSIIIQG